jgi:hypothetical protein
VTITMPPRSTAVHEGAHAAGLLAQGLVPSRVYVRRPEHHFERVGGVVIDWASGPTRETARKVLLSILTGAMAEGMTGWDWPIDPEAVAPAAKRDAQQARVLATYCLLDRTGWSRLRWEAEKLARDGHYRRLLLAIAAELEEKDELSASDLKRIFEGAGA